MTVTVVTTDSFISDFVIFLRDDILNNVTDPISSTRSAAEKFVLTSFPKRNVTYPVVIVQDAGSADQGKLGMQVEIHEMRMELEIRVWARNVKERDEISQDIINRLRSNEFGGTITAELHDPIFLSTVNVDEPGEQGIRSKILRVRYTFLLGT